MANPEHVEIVKRGKKVIDAWRRRNPGVALNLKKANLSGVDLSDVYLGSTSRGIDLSHFDPRVAYFIQLLAMLVYIQVHGTRDRFGIREVDLDGANLSGANLSRTNLNGATLNSADLSYADLSYAILTGVSLNDANLSRSFLGDANLSDASLNRATLNGAYLIGANLSNAILSHVSFNDVDLSYANLSDADLSFADLSYTTFSKTILENTNLTSAKGLDACRHIGSSVLDHTTIRISGGLSKTFIRNCGWPDALIDSLPKIFNDPIQFYSCFISYSHQDEEFAKRLHADLQSNGVRCWYATEDIQGGKKIHEQLDQAIRLYDRLLIILSPHSIASNWVEHELLQARKREREQNRRVLFPLGLIDFNQLREWTCFDTDEGRDLAHEVREYFIPDFSNWKDHDAYKTAFDRLMRDLKQER